MYDENICRINVRHTYINTGTTRYMYICMSSIIASIYVHVNTRAYDAALGELRPQDRSGSSIEHINVSGHAIIHVVCTAQCKFQNALTTCN